jgi:hypothetical protein
MGIGGNVPLNMNAVSENDFSLKVFRIISFNPGFHFKSHNHKRIELNYILQGSCIMIFTLIQKVGFGLYSLNFKLAIIFPKRS